MKWNDYNPEIIKEINEWMETIKNIQWMLENLELDERGKSNLEKFKYDIYSKIMALISPE